MRRTLLIAVVAFLMLWLSGCMVIDCEDYGPPAGVCVVPVHPHPGFGLTPSGGKAYIGCIEPRIEGCVWSWHEDGVQWTDGVFVPKEPGGN